MTMVEEHTTSSRHQGPDLEKALLSALLQAPDRVPDVTRTLVGPDFNAPAHEAIYHALQAATGDGTSDPILIGTRVAATLDPRFAPALPDVLTYGGEPLSIHSYVDELLDQARCRKIQTVGRRLLQLGEAGLAGEATRALEQAVTDVDDAYNRMGQTGRLETGLRDLSWVLTGQRPHIPPPIWGQRDDGPPLFYAGCVNGIFGDPETGKTWLAKWVCVEALTAGKGAAIVDVDHNGEVATVNHLLALGATPDQLADHTSFRYYDPGDADEIRAAISDLVHWAPAVVILDSIGEMMPMLGVKSVDNDELTPAMRATGGVLARTGCCVITIDHLPKSKENRGNGFAIGGGAKRRATDGSYISAEAAIIPSPGAVGRINLYVEKDRFGYLRQGGRGKYLGQMVIDSTGIETITISVGPSDAVTEEGVFRPTRVMEQISREIEDKPDCTQDYLTKIVHARGTVVRDAIARLVEEGYVSITPHGRKHLHRSLRPFRVADQEAADELF